jgi:hypothetical protein
VLEGFIKALSLLFNRIGKSLAIKRAGLFYINKFINKNYWIIAQFVFNCSVFKGKKKMKNFILFLSFTLLSVGIKAQNDELLKWNVSIGLGAPNMSRYSEFVNKTFKIKPNYDIKGKGPFHLKVEYRPIWWLGVGLNVNHSSYKITYLVENYTNTNGDVIPNIVTIKNASTAFNIRGNLHLLNPKHYGPQGDIYWGIGLGYKIGRYKASAQFMNPNPIPTLSFPNLLPIGFETTLGVKYYFTPNIGAYAELGFAKSIIQIGATAAF